MKLYSLTNLFHYITFARKWRCYYCSMHRSVYLLTCGCHNMYLDSMSFSTVGHEYLVGTVPICSSDACIHAKL